MSTRRHILAAALALTGLLAANTNAQDKAKGKAGDTIMATVYKGEIILHDVMVMPPGKQDKQKSK